MKEINFTYLMRLRIICKKTQNLIFINNHYGDYTSFVDKNKKISEFFNDKKYNIIPEINLVFKDLNKGSNIEIGWHQVGL